MIALACALLIGQGIERTPGPGDWVVQALQHQLSLPPEIRPNYRYIAIPHYGDATWQHSLTVSLNLAASRSPNHYFPTWLANGYLAAIDLTRLATTPEELANLIATWDSIAKDEPYVHADKTNVDIPGNVVVIGPHIQPQAAEMLAQLTTSPVPVYRLDHFLVELLDRKYYEFRGFVKADGTLINQTELFRDIGLDEEKAREIDGDLRALMLHSLNTGHQRRIDVYNSLQSRFNEGRVFITRDAVREQKDPNALPFSNLIAFRNAAREIIYELPNGLHGYAITDGQGNLVRAASQDVVTDERIPSPWPKVLSGAIACVRCHGENSGLQPVKHDFATMAAKGTRLLFDLDDSKLTQAEALERIVGLYGNPRVFDKKLDRSREDINDAVFLLTKGHYVDDTQLLSVPPAFAAISKIHDTYRYALVSPHQAMLELGYSCEPDNAVESLNAVLGVAVSEVSFVEAALRSGLSVVRTDFEVAYLDLALKASLYKP